MKFLVDAQLPPALARWLTARGYSSAHVADVGLVFAHDSEIWDYAILESYVIITKDEDFALRSIRDVKSPSILWVRIGNCCKQHLFEWLEPLLDSAIRALESGEQLVELT